ncbi:jg20915 [Pararge aegeria aegeria]|uniref:Jg20915 protein n=1 Tax=Pararge aegeria aegeria TaxID=348720 RepID=A0A8S4RJD7_9NEOP|nr:jg20915 [Pararge aegeria aegeria]
MLDTQFSLSWEQHMNNIRDGLSNFQKSGEFVDMTLAVDGCFVKVHQMILSLFSPYIKNIILSLKCSHPVIFLSNISHQTLCSILDYVYRGEVQVSKEQLEDLIQAGKQLQIEGLQYIMCLNNMSSNEVSTQTECSNTATIIPDFKQAGSQEKAEPEANKMDTDNDTQKKDKYSLEMQMLPTEGTSYTNNNEDNKITCAQSRTKEKFAIDSDNCSKSTNNKVASTPFFTTSNRGSLQLVVGKYMYYLSYYSTTSTDHCQWKCFNFATTNCPSFVITENNRIIKQLSTHSHLPHDLKIARKIKSGELYPNKEGAEFSKIKKKQSCQRLSGNDPTLKGHLSPQESDKLKGKNSIETHLRESQILST